MSSAERAKREKIYPYYGAQGIVDYIDNYIFDGEYVLVAEDGNNLKTLNEPIVTWAKGKFWVNNHAHILGSNGKSNLRFIYYYLMASDLRGLITGSAQPKLNQDNLSTFQMSLPAKQMQDVIARILGAIDDKIEVNKRLIEELEETARLIYDYWFTQFDFPDENGKPYRSSGGKMVWSEKLKREIPYGWETARLKDISAYGKESVAVKQLSASNYISTDNMLKNLGGIVESEYLPSDGTANRFSANDTLLSNIRPYFKKAYLPLESGGCCNDVLILRPASDLLALFLYYTVTANSFFDFMTKGTKGSKMPRGDKQHIMEYPVVVPTSSVLQRFEGLLRPIVNYKDGKVKENKRLKDTRSWLLPMLMSGQASVKNDE